MGKKIAKIKPVEEPEEIDSSNDEEDEGLTYTKRYTVSYFRPEKSSIGSKSYKDFYETDIFSDAKKEAESALKERKVEIKIWDRENWCFNPISLQSEGNKDDTETTESSTNTISGSNKTTDSRPRPKHVRRKV